MQGMGSCDSCFARAIVRTFGQARYQHECRAYRGQSGPNRTWNFLAFARRWRVPTHFGIQNMGEKHQAQIPGLLLLEMVRSVTLGEPYPPKSTMYRLAKIIEVRIRSESGGYIQQLLWGGWGVYLINTKDMTAILLPGLLASLPSSRYFRTRTSCRQTLRV